MAGDPTGARTFSTTELLTACVLSVCVHALAAQSLSSHATDPPRRQTAAPFVPKVASLDELQPKTDEDRAKARLFDGQGSFPIEPGLVVVSRITSPSSAEKEVPPYGDFLRRLVCDGRTLVLGTSRPRRVMLNNTRTYLFTAHDLLVERWVSPLPERPDRVELLTAGGQAEVDGQFTSVGGGRFEAETRYLFFLSMVPGTSSWTLGGSAVKADSAWARALDRGTLPGELTRGEIAFDQFVDDLQAVAATCR